MAEWSKAHDWKSCVVERLPWVQIPSPPPKFDNSFSICFNLTMDPNSTNVSAERIKEIYNILADAMIDGIERMDISEEESKKSADYIFQNLDSIKTQAELINFLEQLCKAWPTYNNVYHKLLNEQKTFEDQKKIAEVENSINNIANNN